MGKSSVNRGVWGRNKKHNLEKMLVKTSKTKLIFSKDFWENHQIYISGLNIVVKADFTLQKTGES